MRVGSLGRGIDRVIPIYHITQTSPAYPAGTSGLGTVPPPAALGGVALISPTAEGAAGQEVPSEGATAPTTSNLLPLSGSGAMTRTAGVYVGEGLPPVPEKLAAKIRAWKFVDMAEMLPEYWVEVTKDDESSSSSNAPTQQPCRRKKVTDITLWLQCYGLYVSVLASQHPQAIPELMAYMIRILRVSQDFAGSAWVNYDSAFRRQADVTGDRKWSRINPSMYSICFAGQARRTARCDICLSSQHSTRECALSSDPDPDAATRLRTLESAVLALVQPTSQPSTSRNTTSNLGPGQVCRLWNVGHCHYCRCRFHHVCKGCGGDRPAYLCCERLAASPPLGQRPQGGGARVPVDGFLQAPFGAVTPANLARAPHSR